ncbi:hypothetical protein WMF20_29255 [Sorangium sp. So ce834]|uniref:hypothetical protein n=1 Tax=Sorangium sp. So ce834 TaxID=3133321 RepID=UPI003F63A4B2
MKKIILMAAVSVSACGAQDDGKGAGDHGFPLDGTGIGDDSVPSAVVGSVGGEPVAESQEAVRLGCSDVCGAAVGAVPAIARACLPFGVAGALACGLATTVACSEACVQRGRRCVKHGRNGKACANSTRFWWCDSQIDGNKVRAWYELASLRQPGVVQTEWAPSQGCIMVRSLSRDNLKRFRVCTQQEGCSEWIPANGAVASAAVYDDEQTPDISLTPLCRYWNGTNLDHFYTASRDDSGAAFFGYSFETSEGTILRNAEDGTVPIYQYWNPTIGDHFYTTNWGELGGGGLGYGYEGITGYILPEQYAGTVPLHRYWSASAGDHFYTKAYHPDGFCYGHCWAYEGILGYVLP